MQLIDNGFRYTIVDVGTLNNISRRMDLCSTKPAALVCLTGLFDLESLRSREAKPGARD